MIGNTVGPYRILEQLGQGGMGIVYKAHDERLGRTVALKFLPPQLSSDDRARKRFIQEARAASALDHANLCTIHDVGQTDDGRVYIVMAYYDGQTLKHRMEDGALPEDEAIQIALQAARGLARAHDAGIVHRDLKPANVMVTDRGEVKILDFGVAKLASSMDLTSEGTTIGTAAYMSPEQSRGENVDYRSDQWSLGVLLYEMLTGKRPFGGGYDAAMVYAILNEAPADIVALLPGLDTEVAGIVRRLLAKQPDDRYASTDSLVSALEQATGASGVLVAQTDVAPRRPVAASTGRIVWVFGVAAAVSLVVVYSAMYFFGLPDWVFTFGVLLMAIGLPILILAGAMERRRASMDSGERSTLSGMPAWLSVRKAAIGGVSAMVLLSVLSGGYMVMRAAGIGPAGTLVSKGALAERDFVVMADFENRTEDPNLGVSIAEAFRIDLSQSAIVNLVDAGTVRDALVRMQRDPDSHLDATTAREVAERVGAKAVLLGDISSIGRSFQLVGRLVDVTDGTELVAIRENAADDGALLVAIDRLSGRLRERIGESLVTIRGGEPLEDVSTASLAALRLYSESERLANTGDYLGSEQLLERALREDSTFAMAWRKLSVVRGNALQPLESQLEAARRAFDLRDRLPERERLLAEARYFSTVVPDEEREIAAYEAVLQKWPDDLTALNNLAISYRGKNRLAEAEGLSRRAIEIGESVVFRQGLINALGLLKKWQEAESEIDDYIAHYPEDGTPWIWLARIAAKQGEFDRAFALLDSAETRVRDTADRNYLANTRATVAQKIGRYAQADALIEGQISVAVAAGFDGAQIGGRLGRPMMISVLDDDVAALRSTLDDLTRRYPLEDMSIRSRPDPFVAGLYAWTGDPDRAAAILDHWRAAVPEELRPDEPTFALALIAFSGGNPEEAFRLLEQDRDDQNCPDCNWELQAMMYERMDSLAAAAAAFERSLSFDRGFDIIEQEAPVRLHLAALYQDLGEPDRAIENYSRAIDLWTNADPDLQVYVRRAQSEFDRLLDMQAREPSTVPSAPGP